MPNEIKHFVWRVCNNALPTKCNLKRRRITKLDVCELCKAAPEDALQALCFCSHVAPMWLPFQWFQSMISPPPLNFCDLLNKFMQVGDELRPEMFATITWSLWNRRNALHFGREALPIAMISSVASALLHDFLASQIPEAPLSRPAVRHQWRHLEPGFVKVNFDAALFTHTNSAGLGVVVRDWRGANPGALSVPAMLSSTVADMEALACLRAVQFATELDLHRVIFEGDSATIISAVSQGSSILSSFGNIVDDVRHLLPSFSSVIFSHVNHSGNIVADALAKKASSIAGCDIWMEALPLDIAVLVDFDVH